MWLSSLLESEREEGRFKRMEERRGREGEWIGKGYIHLGYHKDRKGLLSSSSLQW